MLEDGPPGEGFFLGSIPRKNDVVVVLVLRFDLGIADNDDITERYFTCLTSSPFYPFY
jgi:hypothetical protein